ncbi:MAG: PilX N-terminal domain-containing pilus assembly protein, partial [Porticoccus sp.]
MIRGNYGKTKQQGAILLISIIFLLLLSMLALGTMRSGTLEILMAGNEQSRIDAFELAAGVNESVISRWQGGGGTEPSFKTDKILCSPGHTDPDCDELTLTIDTTLSSAISTAGAENEYATHYLGEGQAPPGFGEQVNTCAFYFDTEADYDNSLNKQGVSHQSEGVFIINPVATDCSGLATQSAAGDLDKYTNREAYLDF